MWERTGRRWRCAAGILALAAIGLTALSHVSTRTELIGGYGGGFESGPSGSDEYYGSLPSLPPVVGPVMVTQTVVPRTSVIVPVCDKLGCYQMNACIDRWDFQTEYGGCEVYQDWTQRMGYCTQDRDAFGVTAALACPVACDSCGIGMCFTPATNELAACDGDGQSNAVFDKAGRRRRHLL